jgi:hypothetical protein
MLHNQNTGPFISEDSPTCDTRIRYVCNFYRINHSSCLLKHLGEPDRVCKFSTTARPRFMAVKCKHVSEVAFHILAATAKKSSLACSITLRSPINCNGYFKRKGLESLSFKFDNESGVCPRRFYCMCPVNKIV